MKSEIEVKFLDVNHDDIRVKLQDIGATCEQPMRLLRRVAIETPQMVAKGGYLRVRDEGDKVTMTYKQFDRESTVDGAKEIEIIVNDFERTVALLKQAGLPHQSFQESKRETWRLGDCEIVLDEWPWLKPYIEIEGESEQKLREIAENLGFDWDDAVFGSVMAAYRAEYPHLEYDETVGKVAQVTFDSPLPDLLRPKS